MASDQFVRCEDIDYLAGVTKVESYKALSKSMICREDMLDQIEDLQAKIEKRSDVKHFPISKRLKMLDVLVFAHYFVVLIRIIISFKFRRNRS